MQETETLENYNLKEETMEINLGLNEEYKIIVDNTKKEIPKIEEPEKNEPENIKEEKIENKEENTKTEIVKQEVVKQQIIKEDIKILPVTGY